MTLPGRRGDGVARGRGARLTLAAVLILTCRVREQSHGGRIVQGGGRGSRVMAVPSAVEGS